MCTWRNIDLGVNRDGPLKEGLKSEVTVIFKCNAILCNAELSEVSAKTTTLPGVQRVGWLAWKSFVHWSTRSTPRCSPKATDGG